MKKTLLSISACLVALQFASAQPGNPNPYIRYTMNTANPSENTFPDLLASPISVGNNSGAAVPLFNNVNPSYVNGAPNTGYSGASGGNYAQATAVNGGIDKNNSTYYSFTLTPTAGQSVAVKAYSFGKKALTANGPTNYVITSSLSSFNVTGDGGLGGFVPGPINAEWRNTNINDFVLSGGPDIAIEVRIYGFNGQGAPVSTAQWALDDIIIYSNKPAGGTLNTLPVKFTEFAGKTVDKSIMLNWKTASEKNNSYFNVLRSTDGKKFTSIGRIAGAGNSDNELSYTFTDENPSSGTNYYMVEQFDFNGENNRFEKVVAVDSKLSPSALSVFASSSTVNLALYSPNSTTAQFQLYDLSGRRLATIMSDVSKGSNQLAINYSLSPGMYFVKMLSEGKTSSVKFIKK